MLYTFLHEKHQNNYMNTLITKNTCVQPEKENIINTGGVIQQKQYLSNIKHLKQCGPKNCYFILMTKGIQNNKYLYEY